MTRPLTTALARLILPLSWWAAMTPARRHDARFVLIVAGMLLGFFAAISYVIFTFPGY